jgi:DNA-binding CsgD family transcriptional regulator
VDAERTPRPSPTHRDLAGDYLDALPDMIFRLDREGRYLDFKPSKELEPFVPPDQFLGRTMHEVLPPGVAEHGISVIEKALASGTTQTYVYQLPMPDGARDYEARVVPLGPEDVLAIVRDTTTQPPRRVPSGRYALTDRELAVLRLVTMGVTDKEIAQRLEISVMTARNHVASIRKKMGAASRTEAGVKAVRESIV